MNKKQTSIFRKTMEELDLIFSKLDGVKRELSNIKLKFHDFNTEYTPSGRMIFRTDGSSGHKTYRKREEELLRTNTIIATNKSGVWSDEEVYRAKLCLKSLTPKYIDGFGLMRMERYRYPKKNRVVFEINGGCSMLAFNRQEIGGRIIPIETDTSLPVRDFLIFVGDNIIQFTEGMNMPKFALPLYSIKIDFKDNKIHNIFYKDLRG